MSEQVSYVYDEICISATGVEMVGSARYDFVRATLNDGLKSLALGLAGSLVPPAQIATMKALPMSAKEAGLFSAFLEDMAIGTELQALLATQKDILRPIAPIFDVPQDGLWVDLAAPSGVSPANRITHYFFQIGDKRPLPKPEDSAERDARQRLVRDLVLLINLNKKAVQGTVGNLSAAPNWLCGIAPDICNSPAAPPLDDPSTTTNGFWSFAFPPGSAAAGIVASRRANHTSSTTVAILDTSPVTRDAAGNVIADTVATVTAFANTFPNNMLLKHVATEVTFTDPISPIPSVFDAMLDYVWAQVQPPVPQHDFSNHGLFVTGIIHDIAPHAETHLIRGTHDGGVSDVRRFTAIMAQLPTQFPNRNLVVNMSVDFTVPPGIELIAKNFTALYNTLVAGGVLTLNDLTTLLNGIGNLFTMTLLFAIEDFTTGVQQDLDSLTNNAQILIVGAAGNDHGAPLHATPSGAPPDPRWPANDDQVLAVAATTGGNSPTRYSNLGDVDVLDNAIATFGGNTMISAAGDPVVDTTNAVRGIGDMSGTATCWIHWAGTSFSTPVISALATDYWDANPHLTAQEVRTAIIGMQDTGVIGSLNCSGITASQQHLNAWWP